MLKKGLLVGGGAAAALAVAALVYIFVLGGRTSAEAGPAPAPTPVHVEGKLGPHIVLPERVFNLASGPGGAKHFLKLGATIEFETTDPAWYKLAGKLLKEALEEFDHDEIGSGRAIIEDIITDIVSGKRVEDISTADGKDALRKEIKAAIAHKIAEPHIYRVLFTSFITD